MREFFLEFWEFLKERKKLWFIPLVILLVLIGMMIVVGQTVIPYLYTIF